MITSSQLARFVQLLLCVCLTAVMGCKEDKRTVEVDNTPKKSEAELAAEREAIRLDQLRERIQRTKELIRQYPEDFENNLNEVEGRLFEAGGTKMEADMKQLLAQVKKSREDHAMQRLQTIIPKVEQLVNEEKDYLTAEEELALFDPEERFTMTEAHKEWEQKADWVQRAFDAENEFKRIERRALSLKRSGDLEDLAKAIGTLVSYSDTYKDTTFYPELQTMADDFFEEYKTQFAERQAEENVEWLTLEIDEYLSSFRNSGKDVWSVPEEGVVEGTNTTEGPAIFEIGEDLWTSYRVQFEIQVPSGQKIHIGATSTPPRPGSPNRQYPLFPVDLETDDWVGVLVEFRDGTLKVKDLNNFEELLLPYNPRSSQGGVAIGLTPGDSVKIRNVKIQVISSLEEADDSED